MGRIMPEGTPESCNVTALLTEVNKRRFSATGPLDHGRGM
jgi:hypothetical protein